ncbi:MAG TPA: hypothetical protein VHZ33_06725 [Trebonia sp.]|jgi:hypothetical protein|nr:hypothetical protein [Trebonia sp.]
MYDSYMLYQAEHTKTARQQREEDTRAGEAAAEFGRLLHSLAPRQAGGHRRFRATPKTRAASAARSVKSCQPGPTAGRQR